MEINTQRIVNEYVFTYVEEPSAGNLATRKQLSHGPNQTTPTKRDMRQKIFLRRLAHSRFLAKTLRVNKIAMTSFFQKSVERQVLEKNYVSFLHLRMLKCN